MMQILGTSNNNCTCLEYKYGWFIHIIILVFDVDTRMTTRWFIFGFNIAQFFVFRINTMIFL